MKDPSPVHSGRNVFRIEHGALLHGQKAYKNIITCHILFKDVS